MNKLHLISASALSMLLSGCMAYKNVDVMLSSEEVKREEMYADLSLPRYFISWEPYHFFITLGILPQYVYQLDAIKKNEDASVSAREHTRCIGWAAFPLALSPDWHYGENPEIIAKRSPTNAS